MSESITANNFVLSHFDLANKSFYLKREGEDEETIIITCAVKLRGTLNGELREVNTGLNLSDYLCSRLVNPYLNAQSDVFKIKTLVGNSNRTIGYIFPGSALEDDEESVDENFDEAKQAYKYYCIRHVIEQHKNFEPQEIQPISISSLINQDSSYLIIYKPILENPDFDIADLLPNLALNGYYNFPKSTKPNILNLLNFGNRAQELDQTIAGRFHYLRNQQTIGLKNSKSILAKSELVKLLYEKVLVEADNPMYRFLILYQIIEYLVDQSFRDGLDNVIKEKEKYSNYKFLQQIHDLNNTRSTINKLFTEVQFEEKTDITNIIKGFILEFNDSYDKQSTGDCLYDIRNLLFHDYRSVLEGNKGDELVGLIIQCEILIHRLVIALGNRNAERTAIVEIQN